MEENISYETRQKTIARVLREGIPDKDIESQFLFFAMAFAKLLDLNNKLDIELLDEVVNALYSDTGERQKSAQNVLTTLKEHPDAWTKVDAILEFSSNQQTKYYALQILENVIKTRWKVLPRHQCEGIKKYIVGLIIKTSSDPQALEKEKTYLNKLNMILVQILKREWPKNWNSFIPDIIGASKTNESLCQNNMVILKLLSEELFDFSTGQMTQTKAKHLKDTMCTQFSEVFKLCEAVMSHSQNATLVGATLDTLLRFLNWIPLGYIFETKLIDTLILKFLSVPMFRNLFTQTMQQLEQMLPAETDIKSAYSCGVNSEQLFIQDLSLFICTFLKEHGSLVEKSGDTTILYVALHYLLLISEVEEVEIFKICLEYWNSLTGDLYRDSPSVLANAPLFMSRPSAAPQPRLVFKPILTKVRYIMISRMAKPEEVLVVENDQGEVVREFMKDTDSINMYKTMRETLVYLTHLDYGDTEKIMTEKLQNQVNGNEWSWKNLNTLCWAIGSISGSMHEEDEKRFLVTVIKDLLGLCEQKKGKDNKAIIASNIMYIVGQYPRFLRAHWRFLKTEFRIWHAILLLKSPKSVNGNSFKFSLVKVIPFIDDLISNINSIICDLQQQQVHTFYEAVGHMISAASDSRQDFIITKYMQLPNQVWDDIISQAAKNVDVLKDHEAVKQLGSILKTNVRACKALGHPYVVQLGHLYLDMLNVYKVMSENIATATAINGEQVKRQPLIKLMRGVKKETLKLISCWVENSNEPQNEPEVLSTMATVVNKLKGNITLEIPKIFDALFECTLNMINKDFEEYPEHRTNFFILLQAVNQHCFKAFLNIPPAQFKLVLDSIIWAFKHTMRNVADTGLNILLQLLRNVSMHPDAAQSFYQTYYTDIVQHVFSVVTDSSHTAGLAMHASILAAMFTLLENDRITVVLNPNPPPTDNAAYVRDFVSNLLITAFPHLSKSQINITVKGLFDLNQDIPAFREHLRDFLVQIREFTGEDDSDLYLEEREADLKKAQEEKRKAQMAVPGILNPHEIQEEMQEA
ncbi:XPO1 [Lepeophtheirus salmonis]|uniref:Exportin-1 n=1 Tax=Lepeophtheirus salmonis TaxID=72036 RepID=A0A7R8D1S7_LEPSM|nr:XPO1 [Lepeophtheirus salmonis]CAF2997446.1 XPO1 [Lepeophtheirus salmonis]